VTRRLGSHSESLRVAVQKVRKNIPQEPTRSPEEEGKRIGNLLISLLAGSQLLRIEVLDRVEIDRQEIVHMADNIEKQVMELAHLVLGADISEWQAEQERKRGQA